MTILCYYAGHHVNRRDCEQDCKQCRIYKEEMVRQKNLEGMKKYENRTIKA